MSTSDRRKYGPKYRRFLLESPFLQSLVIFVIILLYLYLRQRYSGDLSMKSRSCFFTRLCACASALALLISAFPHAIHAAEPYTATTMRLLRYEGTVEIEDAAGKPRPVMENARLSSGESMSTGESSSASVGLDKGRIVTLDALSRVEFEKADGALSMNLTQGNIFLDVSEKLDKSESMDIKTSTMVVGIRGTIVYASETPVTDENTADLDSIDLKGLTPGKGSILSLSRLGVLEGTARITYLDEAGREQALSVEAGKKAIVPKYSDDAEEIPVPVVSDITPEDIQGFVLDQAAADETVLKRVQDACDVADDITPSAPDGRYTADGDWTWDRPVTLVAQSASKYYDGQPLTRTSDILVDGLPSTFSVRASAGGSRTDAGESDNPVSNYTIYNAEGEDITRHFTNVQKVSGTLLVIPAPLTIHTGSAQKVYDGTRLTDPEAYVTFYKGSGNREVPWRNTSYVVTERSASASSGGQTGGSASSGGQTGSIASSDGQAVSGASSDGQTLYGICGVIWVNAANPLTGERREIQLKAGQKLSVFLSDRDGRQSIDLKTEKLTEYDLPEEILRLYGDNEALLQQACKDTGWKIELIQKRIDALPKARSGDAAIEQGGLKIRESESDRLMQDLTTVNITIDTDITDYNDRALGSEEAHYTSLAVDESIKVTAAGSRTDVGAATNNYTIDWGTANRSNYEVSEDLGTLTVTPASVTVTTGSAEKEYDGTPLTNDEASISGLVNGETAAVTATGSITKVGSTANTYSIRWGSADSSNYNVSEQLGTLRVTGRAPRAEVTLTAASARKTYDGTALTDSSFTSDGLPDGFSVTATVSGSRTDAGSSKNKITSYTIYDENGKKVTDQFTKVTTVDGTLTVDPAPATVTTGSAEKAYDGSPLTSFEASVSGIVPSEEGYVTVTATGTITDVGTADNTYSIDWGRAKSSNYTLSESLGTLAVTQNDTKITFTSASAEKIYDGTELSARTVTVEGLPDGLTYKCSAGGTFSVVDAGSYKNYFDDMAYTFEDEDGNPMTGWRYAAIYDADGKDVTDCFTNINLVTGTLTVKPLPVEFNFHFPQEESDGVPTFVYDRNVHSPEWITASYEGAGEGLEPDDWNLEGEGGAYSFTFHLPGGAALRLDGNGYADAGEHSFDPSPTFTEGNADNYELSFVDNSIKIEPVEIVLISYDSYWATSDVHIEEYDLKVQVNKLAEDDYTVYSTGENEWRIDFYWGDQINVGKVLTKGETSFTIHPIYDFASGDPGNYSIETVDQEGSLTEAAHTDPDTPYGMSLPGKTSVLPSSDPSDPSKDSGAKDADDAEGVDVTENTDSGDKTGAVPVDDTDDSADDAGVPAGDDADVPPGDADDVPADDAPADDDADVPANDDAPAADTGAGSAVDGA